MTLGDTKDVKQNLFTMSLTFTSHFSLFSVFRIRDFVFCFVFEGLPNSEETSSSNNLVQYPY